MAMAQKRAPSSTICAGTEAAPESTYCGNKAASSTSDLGLLAPTTNPSRSGPIDEVRAERIRRERFASLSDRQRQNLAVELMRTYNKVTHVYELVKASGSTSRVTFDRGSGRWRRKDSIAVKHDREVAVDPIAGRKSHDEAHAPLLYEQDPRADLPATLRARIEADLGGADDRIVKGWLATD